MLGDVVRSNSAVRKVFRERITALGLAYSTVDAIAGLGQGYTQKVLSEPPARDMGTKAMWLLAGALGICFVPLVDHEQTARVKGRWIRRQRNCALQFVAGSPDLADDLQRQGEHSHVE